MQIGEMPLAEAAHRLGWSWARAFNALLCKRLEGERRGGRWFVKTHSVEQLLVAEKPAVNPSDTTSVSNAR